MSEENQDNQNPEPPVEFIAGREVWTGASAYLLYVTAAAGKSHRNEPLPTGFDDLTEERQAVWNRFAAALNG